MEIVKIKADALIPADYNPRKDLTEDDAEFKRIKRSIEEFGYVEPIIINKDYTIIGGHQRLKVLKMLGYEEVECVIVNVNKEKEKALNIALNKIKGEWDIPKLKDVLKDLYEGNIFDIELTGFGEDEVKSLIKEINIDNFFSKEEREREESENMVICPACGEEFEP